MKKTIFKFSVPKILLRYAPLKNQRLVSWAMICTLGGEHWLDLMWFGTSG